jgi:hypothetical protein
MKLRLYAVAATTVLIIAVLILATFIYVSNSHQQKDDSSTSSSTNSFFGEPVVDIIIPTLYSNGINAPLNLTTGSNASLLIEVFPTVNLKCVFRANVSSLSDPNENLSDMISTSITPGMLTIAQESSANTTLRITASTAAQQGGYSVTVTAINSDNESQYWGAIFRLNVLS